MFSTPLGTEMFYFPRFASRHKVGMIRSSRTRFPHSEISGSKVARHLPEAYRSHATSFIASSSQGIHHMLLNFLLGNLKITLNNFNSLYVYLPASNSTKTLDKLVVGTELEFQTAFFSEKNRPLGARSKI